MKIARLGSLERSKGNRTWPLAYLYAFMGVGYFALRRKLTAPDLECFGWQCVAVKKS